MHCAKRASVRLFVAAVFAAAGFVMAPSAFAGTNDNVTGWVWSGTVGWISMNCSNPVLPGDPAGTCATVNYGVTLEDAGGTPAVANLKGYAWSETVGWVCFGTTCTGTTPEGASPYAQYRELHSGKASQFWGWAKVLSFGNDGWIALNCDKDAGADECGMSNYYVGLDTATGDFNPGVQVYDHFAWSGTNEGTGLGWIDFSIATTSWAPANLGIIRRPAGIYEPQSTGGACVTDANCVVPPHLKCNTGTSTCVLPGTHVSPFAISFENFSGAKDTFLECEILLPDGSRRVLNEILSSTIMNGTEDLSYVIQPGDATSQNTLWYITSCRLAGLRDDGSSCSCVGAGCSADASCGPGAICEESAGKCRDILAQSNKRRPIFAHPNEWTGLGAEQDQYSAIKCNAGFPDNYFRNAAQCDFTGDASFALAMRRGIPVEGDCGDGIDNDGNGQVDCADRYCKGVSYLCSGATLPRTTCTWGQVNDGIDDCSALPEDSGLCCTKQPLAPGATQSHIVDGLECKAGDPRDGYYDCSCLSSTQFDASPTDDCFAPGAQPGTGDLCCNADSNVTKL